MRARVLACVRLTRSLYASKSYCTAVERGIFIFCMTGYGSNVRTMFSVPGSTKWELHAFHALILLIVSANDKMCSIKNT